MNKDHIEQAAHDLRERVDYQRRRMGVPLASAVDAFNPHLGAAALGVHFVIADDLGLGIAGVLDRPGKRIAVASRFPYNTQRFTGAHELGHWILHKGTVMHRDRPIEGLNGPSVPRRPEEAEADHFAACYLMPRWSVEHAFADRFGTRRPFVVNDDAAHLLSPNDREGFLYGTDLECAAVLASADRYGRSAPFDSLAKAFRVSVKSMAIRIIELRLI